MLFNIILIGFIIFDQLIFYLNLPMGEIKPLKLKAFTLAELLVVLVIIGIWF